MRATMQSEPERLTGREHEIMQLVAQGYSDTQIALLLKLPSTTVAGQVRDIYRKLQATNRLTAAVTYDRRYRSSTAAGIDRSQLDTLSHRDREVLNLILRGLTDYEIAREMKLEYTTVRHYVRRVCQKLNAHNRIAAAVRYRRMIEE